MKSMEDFHGVGPGRGYFNARDGDGGYIQWIPILATMASYNGYLCRWFSWLWALGLWH